MSEEQRQELIAELEKRHPGIDIRKKLAGSLAGPPDDDRPAIPVWEYPAWARSHPGFTAGTTRFLAIYEGGHESASSLNEWSTEDDPDAPLRVSAADAARLFQMLHDEGLLEWVADRRAVRFLTPPDARRAVTAAWAAEIRRTARG